MSADTVTVDEARQRLYEIMEGDAGFHTKARGALELGEEFLGVENGHMTAIDPESDYWEAIAGSADGEYRLGTVLDLRRTFCREAIERRGSLVLHDAPNQGWADDPAFEATDLHTYHGTAIELRKDLYGTVCFVADAPREQPFEQEETLFAELVARMLEHELSCDRYETELGRRTELLDVVNRVLRHNLRNDLNYVRGRIRMLSEGEAAGAETDGVIDTVEGLLELSETARQLDSVVRGETEFGEIELTSLVDRVAADVCSEYPEASIDTSGPAEVTVMGKPTLRVAIRELLENAVEHGGEAPNPIVGVEETETGATLRVADDGCGLPDQERAALTTGSETPLVHGSGLGLWMVYWIVTEHGGSVDVTVTESGTTITVSLTGNPLADP